MTFVRRTTLDGLRQAAAAATRERDDARREAGQVAAAAAVDKARAEGQVRDAETRMADLRRALAAAREDLGQARRELAAERERTGRDAAAALAAAVLEARVYAWETGTRMTFSRTDAEKHVHMAAVQKNAATVEAFLLAEPQDLAGIRQRMAAVAQALAECSGLPSETELLTRARIIFLFLAGRPGDVAETWDSTWWSIVQGHRPEPDPAWQ